MGVAIVVPSPGWLPGALAGEGLPVTVHPMKGAAFYHLLGRMIRERRARRVDVLHTHLTRAAYFGHVFGRLTGTPIVTSVHIANYDKIYRRLAHGANRLVAVSGFIAEHLQASGVDVLH
ncbi:MAG: hypothetical protein C4320_07250, partial [Armatimonadota bacterium]